MQITRENTGDLTATVKIAISPEDYDEKVTKLLKDYQKKANIPGFRPGHVPYGMVKKMYGKAIQTDEINKLISDTIMNYIEEEKLQILGNPIPNREKNGPIDFENQTSYDFYFDLGFAPEINLELSSVEVEKYVITVDDEMVDRYVESIRKQFGTPEASQENIGEENTETDENSGEEKVKPEPKVTPAELTPELFDRVFPGKEIQTIEDFREEVRGQFALNLVGESDQFFFRQVSEKLVKEIEFQLPDDFLKKWLLDTNEGKYTAEEIEKDYPVFVESMKWQLIENKILKDHQIEVKDEDIRAYIRNYFLRNIPLAQDDPEIAKRYDSLVDTLMQNKEQVRKINDEIYTARLLEVFKSTLKIENKDIPYNEFVKVVAASRPHDHDHEHHDHDHDHHHHDHEHEHDHHHHDHDHEHDHDHDHDHKH